MNVVLRFEKSVGRMFGVGRVRVHPLFLALIVGAYLVGLLKSALLLFLFVILHEFGHALTARFRGYDVEEVSLLPFGGVAKLAYVRLGFTPRDEALVAISGPFVNLLCCIVLSVLYAIGAVSGDFYSEAMQLNIWIAVFNLLPGLPLDGGRILRAARSRQIGYERATVEAYQVSFVLSAVLLTTAFISLFVGHPHLGMLMLGVFLLVTAVRGRRDLRAETMRFLDAKRRETGRVLPMQALAVKPTATVRDVVVLFAPDRHHIIYVIGDDGLVETLLEEVDLLDAVFEGKWMEPIRNLC